MKRYSFIIVLMVMLMAFSGCYMVQTSKDYFGIGIEGKSILFVVDVSGSMEGKDEGSLKDQVQAEAVDRAASEIDKSIGGRFGRIIGSTLRKESTKLGEAKRQLIPAVKGLPEDTRFTILLFGGQVKAWQATMVPATTSNKGYAVAYLQGLKSGGGTPAKAALQQAFTFRGVDTIFFLTDGHPTDGSASTILAKVRQLNKGKRVTIHAIGLGEDQDANFLCDLATQNKGYFVREDTISCKAPGLP